VSSVIDESKRNGTKTNHRLEQHLKKESDNGEEKKGKVVPVLN
jgi:hypothetical protein